MCGIVGIVGPWADTHAERWLPGALAALRHRGPDGSGSHLEANVAFGHTRLAIIDLGETGKQPMHSATGDTLISFNGEVYNFPVLGKALQASGWRPRGHSDTEVVLEHLARHGSDGLSDLDGMFALALFSRRDGSLLLARDRVGIKPLYYACIGDSVAFASELSTLVDLPGVDRSLDPVALSHYLSLGMVPSPFTMLAGVRQLEPGCALRRDAAGRVEVFRYTPWVGEDPMEMPSDPRAQDELLEQIILAAVGEQLVADVPVGVLLSGGVDSSIVAAATVRHMSGVRTFSVVHDNPAYDERRHARAVARHIGSEHIEIDMPKGGLTRDELEELVWHHGDPFADSSSLPTRKLAREVRKHVTVALSGDGGDELFAGYPRYWVNQLVEGAARLPAAARRPLRGALHGLTRRLPGQRLPGFTRRVGRTLALADRDRWERSVGTLTYYWPDEQRSLLAPGWHATPGMLQALLERRATAAHDIRTVDGCHRMEQHLVLPGEMLTKVDRMTMAESLEIRPPLLANKVMRFAAALPIERKMVGREGKAILRALARRWVPPEVVDRTKMGFAVPLIDYGGAVLDEATRWALQGADSPLQRLFTADARARLGSEFRRRGDGVGPEDSAFRRAHRQWTITVLAKALVRLKAAVPGP